MNVVLTFNRKFSNVFCSEEIYKLFFGGGGGYPLANCLTKPTGLRE